MKNTALILIFMIVSGILVIAFIHFTNTYIKTKIAPYSINHYTDTINGHIILSTVCNYSDNISISTLELNNNDTIIIR